MSRFIPNSILISGATSGIGFSLAEKYADEGKTLLLTGRNEERLAEITARCRQKGAKVIAKAFDIRETNTLMSWLQEIIQTTEIDLAIANAGISSGVNPEGENESLEKIREVLEVNFHSAIHMIHPLATMMRKRKHGQIALISSLAAFRGFPHSPAYCASKAALRVFGESLRASLRKDNVFLSIVCPGFVKTPMSDNVKGPKPYSISANEAAKIIQTKLEKKPGEIIFPLRLKYGLNFLNLLPKRIADSLLVGIKTHSGCAEQ